MVTRVRYTLEVGAIDDAHSSECLCNDAGDDTLEEESVFVVKDVEARREEEIEV